MLSPEMLRNSYQKLTLKVPTDYTQMLNWVSHLHFDTEVTLHNRVNTGSSPALPVKLSQWLPDPSGFYLQNFLYAILISVQTFGDLLCGGKGGVIMSWV